MVGERVSERNTLAYLENLVQTQNPEITITAVELRLGNPYHRISKTIEASRWRYLVFHQPLSEPRDPKAFHKSPIGSVPPFININLEKLALIRPTVLTRRGAERLEDGLIKAEIRLALEDRRKHRSNPDLVDEVAESYEMEEFMKKAGHVLDGAAPSVVAGILSDGRPILSRDGADDAHTIVYRTDTHPDFDVVAFAVKDWEERYRIQTFNP